MQPEDHLQQRVIPGPPQGKDVARSRCRSFCFLERSGIRWTAFLVTYLRRDGHWRGYFTFRSAAEEGQGEVRTADLFLEGSEADVDARARGLGRPLLRALLDSALATHERRQGFSPGLHRWFRALLARQASSAGELGGEETGTVLEVPPSLARLHTQYESYRIDQVAHLIALIDPDDFRELVEILLEGRRIDYRANDRFQMAMQVVQDLERRLPLPPFEIWVEDYLANTAAYDRYAATLHSGTELP